MWCSKRSTPVSAADRNNGEFGDDDGSTDRRGDFFGGFDAEADVAFRVTNNDDGFETRALAGASLFLDRFYLWRSISKPRRSSNRRERTRAFCDNTFPDVPS